MTTHSRTASNGETITYVDSSEIFGKLFAYLKIFAKMKRHQQILQTLTDQAAAAALLIQGTSGQQGERFISKKALETARSWKAQRTGKPIKTQDMRRPYDIQLTMKMSSLSRRGDESRLLTVNSPNSCQRKRLLLSEIREHGRIC